MDGRERISPKERREMAAQGRKDGVEYQPKLGEMVIFDLHEPPGYGVGRVTQRMVKGLDLHWHGGLDDKSDEGEIKPYFLDSKGKPYWGERRQNSDRPMTTRATRTKVTDQQIGDVFELEPDGRIPAATLGRMAANPNFEWRRRYVESGKQLQNGEPLASPWQGSGGGVEAEG